MGAEVAVNVGTGVSVAGAGVEVGSPGGTVSVGITGAGVDDSIIMIGVCVGMFLCLRFS